MTYTFNWPEILDANTAAKLGSQEDRRAQADVFRSAAQQLKHLADGLCKRDFRPGDPVEFTHRGRVIKGLVIRVSRKTVSVQPAGEARYWRVAPSLLRPSQDQAEPTGYTPGQTQAEPTVTAP